MGEGWTFNDYVHCIVVCGQFNKATLSYLKVGEKFFLNSEKF